MEFNVLDEGKVSLIDMIPSLFPEGRTADFAIIQAAGISTGRGLKSEAEDKKLLRYLYINKHTSPFESVIFTFYLRLPCFVATHFLRHRTGSFNCLSQRYTPIKESFFHPSRVPGSLRIQSRTNRQASDEEIDNPEVKSLIPVMEAKVSSLFEDYNKLLEMGVGREVARSFLPLSTYTEMYFTMNLRNLLHFLELRFDSHTQKETRDYAEAIYKILKIKVPWTMDLFDERRVSF